MRDTTQSSQVPSIFRAYDIRGVYPDEIDETVTRQIGMAFARHVKKTEGVSQPHILVSRDARLSSPLLTAAFIEGLFAEGARVTDAGLTTTPMHYFGINALGTDGGAMITASHNPPLYNGIKLSGKDAVPIGAGSGLEEIARLSAEISATATPLHVNSAAIERRSIDLAPSYVDYLITLLGNPDARTFEGVRIAVDAGNGMAGPVLPYIFERLGITYYPLYFEPDGAMPHHEANPAKEETLEDLRTVIKESAQRRSPQEAATIGAAFDGDGDRIGFLTHQGEHIRGDIVVGILGVDLVRRHPGAGVVYTTVSSRLIPEAIERAGGRAIQSRVGSRFVPEVMR
ncbi:MAG: phosphomannomutase/phosphoglucomutase, partial [Patescibacteria group bacterium]|nr:phosphomannomutase/phosphoglucomutase [Patescibacteria group bacterium]